jgi:hypothetical protein
MSHICPAVLEIENHTLLVIASDSYDFQPVMVDSLVSTSGERYDFVVNANQTGGKRDLRRCFVLSPCWGICAFVAYLQCVQNDCEHVVNQPLTV